MAGDQTPCGSNLLFPYPATENGQKAIGGHVICLSGKARIRERSGECWRL